MNSETNNGLVVPVNIAALCVGINDFVPTGTEDFAGATTTFENQSKGNAFLSANVIRSLSQSAVTPLTKGVHLHWALPEAMTRGNYSQSSKKLDFTTTPNRWLLNRIMIKGGNVTRKSWIIESDTLQSKVSAGKPYVSLPVKTMQPTDQNFMFAGLHVDFSPEWTEKGDTQFEALTGNKISSVSSGDVSFAAFYPNSAYVFGFYDEMADIAAGDKIDVMYQVTGWFSSNNNDPLKGGKTLQEIQEAYGWTFTDANATPDHTLFSGVVQAVSWDVNRDYVVNGPNKIPVNATVTIGNNPAETFSAYFRDMFHRDNSFFEQLLNAFQIGLLNEFRQPQADQLAQMQEIIYQKQFASVNSGTVYSVTKKAPGDQRSKQRTQDEEEEVKLPLQLAEALNLLNVYQQQLDFYNDYIIRFKWQLFSNWYRMFIGDKIVSNKLSAELPKIADKWDTEIEPRRTALTTQRDSQYQKVATQVSALGQGMELKADPAARYWQANEPVALITTEKIELRFGHAGKNESGYLPCRLSAQLLTAITVKSVNINASQFASIALGPNKLPDAACCNALIEEACLLNTNLAGAIAQLPPGELEGSLKLALDGEPQNIYTFNGILPSDHSVKWWNGNPWHPIMIYWETKFAPLQSTEINKVLQNYNPQLFINNYSIQQNEGGSLKYTGSADPKDVLAKEGKTYSGSAVVSPSAAKSFEMQLDEYLNTHTDQTLQEIRNALGNGTYFSAALNGFNASLLMQQQQLQLPVKATGGPYKPITDSIAPIIGHQNTISPMPNGSYNPIRAGYMQPKLVMVDVYGQKREVKIEKIICADSVTTQFNKTIETGIVYMPARLSQPSRLIFRWLSGTGDAIEEMNAHPATSPVCGWLLPNHLDGSLFIYNQQGKALGTLMLNGNQTAILWQSAPGGDSASNKPITDVFEFENPQLASLAYALLNGPTKFFIDFARAIDSMSNFVNPQNYAQSSDMAILIGRPVAVTQVLLKLELEGGPVATQSWASAEQGKFYNDSNYTSVKFPVILGDLEQVNDGLLGYFLPGDGGYNFSTFYSEAASGNNGVIKPTPATITLTPSPKADAPNMTELTADALTVLMLVDPRATIHASTGILPTKKIDIPADQYMDTLSRLEMTFLTTPVLKGVTGFNLPIPKEEGYEWSWVQPKNSEGGEYWEITAGIGYETSQAVAAYTPQSLNEGWLKLNPQLLLFEVLNMDKQPQAKPNAINTLKLVMTNKKPVPLEFKKGNLVNEGNANTGSVFYIHFGRLVPQENVPHISITCDGWQFKALNDAVHGNYWAATPLLNYTMGAGASLNVTLSNVQTANITGQVQVNVDYYNIEGVNNGIGACLVTLAAEGKTNQHQKNLAHAS